MTNPTDSDRATAERIWQAICEDVCTFEASVTIIAAALAAEREACAKVADDVQMREAGYAAGDDRDGLYVEANQHIAMARAAQGIAAAIRARSNPKEK